MTIFEATDDDIQRLSEAELPELLNRLLRAESQIEGYDLSAINLSTNINAGDGGIDAVLNSDRQIVKKHGFITNYKIVFQVKATKMPPVECRKEIENNCCYKAREKIANGYHYILFCNKDNPASTDKRLESIKQGLENNNINFHDRQIHFYDLNKIREWVN